MATVVLVGTLDTKGPEYAFVKQCLYDAGVTPLVIDVGVLGEPSFLPDVSAAEISQLAGKNLSEIRFGTEGSENRAKALEIMASGLSVMLRRLCDENRCDAILGLGGSGGSSLLGRAMQQVPLGIPKLLVSTMMSGDVKGYVGEADITMMHSVTDIAGLNRFSRRILSNAAHAAAGMALRNSISEEKAVATAAPLIALTMFGITTPAVLRMREGLERRGFETVVFHAVGSGGRAMEKLIEEGFISGVIDCTLAELCAYHLGGIFSAGPNRLTAAGKKGIPQVIVPGALEVLNFGPRETLPARFDVPERKLIIHNPQVCAVKATADELKELGEILASKVNSAQGPTAVLLPLKGLDKYDAEDGPWYDPHADAALFEVIRSKLRVDIDLEEVNANINDPVFADAALEKFLQVWELAGKELPSVSG